jgi:hypothetical protein
MGQEDRLKKQIDQLAKALAKMLAKLAGIKQANTAEAVEQVNQNLKNELNLNLDELAGLPDDQLISILTIDHQLNNGHLSQLADILYTSAKLQSEGSDQLSQKALILYRHLAATSKNYSLEWHNKIAELSKVV